MNIFWPSHVSKQISLAQVWLIYNDISSAINKFS
jgi:hypothetical protein